MWFGREDRSLVGRIIKSVLVSVMLIASVWSLVACSASSIEQERKVYTREATNEGNIRAQSQGHGLNGALVNEISKSFEAKGIQLMNNMSADDDHGGISYMYLLNGSGRHIVKVHIFGNKAARVAGMKQMYSENGDEAVLENVLGRTTIRSKDYVSLVYTASGGEKDEYEPDVLQVFQHVLEQLR
ncbi:hypothetical protein BK131_05460 [Paenibacillus amylolyticus]|uniref:Uncharacterized protein n=1 Tax=Paenibacillus amylolyticus TaxID=1451 RepID=A0A1R1C5Q6_PAEAM|nr:hypothetical protein [Paenibacillus amylolyticus]OMF17411.1 hypothetical protein BK131_05460 [Paenibacillus amylolyticus]